jgi:hypothetical protein
MRFGITKDFDSSSGRIGKTDKRLELIRFEDEYTLLEHIGDNVGEIYTFTKEELRTLWMMMSVQDK